MTTRKRNANWGGARAPGPGKKLGPPKSIIHLTDAAREKLRRVWRARTLHEPGLTEDEIVNSAIMALPETTSDEWDGQIV